MIRSAVWLLPALALVVCATASAQSVDPPSTPADFGGSGLLQIPTAQMGDDGDIVGFASLASPYRRFGASATVLPWAQIVLRFTQITDVPYGPSSFSGDQPYLDRGIDARFRLFKQNDYLPDLTLGLRDVAGTGLFDAEYLVATGAFDDIDLTLGLGWGELASDNMFRNPLAFITGRSRPISGAAGSIRDDYFAGASMSLFGGIAIRTPVTGLTVQLEYDPDDGRQDPFRQQAPIHANNPVDVGVVYQPLPWLTLAAGYERGNTAMLKLAISGNVSEPVPGVGPQPTAPTTPSNAGNLEPEIVLDQLVRTGWRLISSQDDGATRHATIAWVGRAAERPSSESIGHAARVLAGLRKPASQIDLTMLRDGNEQSIKLDTRDLELSVAETGRTSEAVEAVLVAASTERPSQQSVNSTSANIEAKIAGDLDAIDFQLESIELKGTLAIIRFHQDIYRASVRAVGEAARATLPDLPSEVALVTFDIVEDGVDIASISLLRHELEAAFDGEVSTAELIHHVVFSGGTTPGTETMTNPDAYPSIDYSVRPGLVTDTAGPDGLLLYNLEARLRADASISPGIIITTELAASLASDFNRLRQPSDSVLPHVRSDISEYLRDGKYGIGRLQTDVIRQPLPDLYARLSAGLLEDMFGGADAEVLYRPYDADWAAGIDVNHVWQRGFHERLSFRPYQVTTAVLEGYERLGWYGLTVGAKLGRYLAGDAGGTVELSRTFDSGVKIGAFATLTTASGRQFGEGRFDKGFYVSVPLDQLIGFASRDTLDYTYRPVTRDGGQLIAVDKPLYELTSGAGPRDLQRDWSQIAQ